jgi:hypothetical protein
VGVKRITGVETHNYRRSREHGCSVGPWAGTYRMAKREEVDPDDEHDGGIPVLQRCQACHNSRNSGSRTAMNSANTIQQPCERSYIRTRWKELTPGFSSVPTVFHLRDGQDLTLRSTNTGVTDLVPKGQEVVV